MTVKHIDQLPIDHLPVNMGVISEGSLYVCPLGGGCIVSHGLANREAEDIFPYNG